MWIKHIRTVKYKFHILSGVRNLLIVFDNLLVTFFYLREYWLYIYKTVINEYVVKCYSWNLKSLKKARTQIIQNKHKTHVRLNKHHIIKVISRRVRRASSPVFVCSDFLLYMEWKYSKNQTHKHTALLFSSWLKVKKQGHLDSVIFQYHTLYLTELLQFLLISCCSTHRIPASLQRSCSSPLFQTPGYPWLQSNPPLSPQAS